MDGDDSAKDSSTGNPVVERLLASLKSYYNINYIQDADYLVARCDYFEKSESFMVSKKANLWSANAEEFLYLFYVPNLTSENYDSCMAYVNDSWKGLAHIGPDHMYTYVTPVFVCDSFEKDALKKLKKCRIYKSYKFSIHGWMEYHTALVCGNEIFSNGRGRCVKKMLLKVLDIKQVRRSK